MKHLVSTDAPPAIDVYRAALEKAPDKSVVLCSVGESWDQLSGHPAWDETAVLIAVRGWEPFFNLERGRFEMVGDKGEDCWMGDVKSICGRVTEKLPKTEVGRIIDELMCRPPKYRRAPL